MCFVFKSAVVFLCKERLRQKKKLMVSFERLISILLVFYPIVIIFFYRVYQAKVKWK